MAITYVVVNDYSCKFDAEVEIFVEKAERSIGIEDRQTGGVVLDLRLGREFSRVVEMGVHVVGPGNEKKPRIDSKGGV